MTKARDLSIGIPSGLVLITPTSATGGTVNPSGTVTVGTAVSSVTVTGAFSATYDAYKIVLTGGFGSGSNAIGLTLGAGGSGYYFMGMRLFYGGSGVNNINENNATSWGTIGDQTTTMSYVNVDLMNPFLARKTTATALIPVTRPESVGGFYAGFLDNTTSYTAFTLTPGGSQTLTGGTISVYGYRK